MPKVAMSPARSDSAEKQCRIHQRRPAPTDAAQMESLPASLLSAVRRALRCSGGKRSIQLSYGPVFGTGIVESQPPFRNYCSAKA